jgi:MFS family permease
MSSPNLTDHGQTLDSNYSQDSKSLNFDPAFEVHLEPHEDPQMLPPWRKWLAISVISISSFCVTSLSSVAAMTEVPVAREFHVSKLVATLGVSLFVEGLGVGPLVVGPLSEVYGRNLIYRTSFALIFAISFGVTFAPNLGKHAHMLQIDKTYAQPITQLVSSSVGY